MSALAEYFATIPSSHRALILAGGIAVFWIWESAWPLFRFEYRKWPHALVNFFFTATTIVVNFALAFLLLRASEWAVGREFGLLFVLPAMPLLMSTVIGLLVLDLISAWLAHFVSHKTPPLWKLHLIHHSDTHVDTTTANRHHPGESIVRFAFTALAVVLAGAPPWMVFLYQAMSVVLSQFNHANITILPALDRALSWFIVSPHMHKVHHHFVLPHTDSNYGNIFSVWDRLFGTFRTIDPSQLVYGIDTHMDANEHGSIRALLTMPFRPKPQPGRRPMSAPESTSASTATQS